MPSKGGGVIIFSYMAVLYTVGKLLKNAIQFGAIRFFHILTQSVSKKSENWRGKSVFWRPWLVIHITQQKKNSDFAIV